MGFDVAPYVGAWIETEIADKKKAQEEKSHPTWVRGLKPHLHVGQSLIGRRTLRGCVD